MTRSLLILSLLCALATTATAMPSPLEPKKPGLAMVDEDALYLGPVGAMLESDYFGVPRPPIGAARIFPCRLRLQAEDRDHIVAQICD
jgi:hypothetical protein